MYPKYILPIVLVFILAGCDTDRPDETGAGEEELINEVTIILSPQGGGDDVVAIFGIPNGEAVPRIDDIILNANTVYDGSISLKDVFNNIDITAEVAEEQEDHQLWYTPGGDAVSRLTITITDMDDNGLPVGLNFTVAVSDGGAASGTLQVVLSHYDSAPKDGVKMSIESDVDITFPVIIEAN